MLRHVLLAHLLFALPALAETCPPAPDHSDALNRLEEEAQAATSESAARDVSDRMWELWADAPNAKAQAVLDRGMQKRLGADYAGAIAEFDDLIAYCPDYAEGYNQRAFVHFILRDYASALPDLDRALDLSPGHIGARAGLALTLMQLGQIDEARAELEVALGQNPWMSERHLLDDGGPLAPAGKDI